MKAIACALAVVLTATGAAGAADLKKTYSYFSIGGNTLDDIERDLNRKGPNVATTGQRHPGATRMEFKTRLKYADHGNYCELGMVSVRMDAKVILPRWHPGRRASFDTRFVWDTLAADIKRHEESHVGIAKNAARELETALKGIGRRKTCQQVSERAKIVSDRILTKHDQAQQRFDRIESANFERRLLTLLGNRMKRLKRS